MLRSCLPLVLCFVFISAVATAQNLCPTDTASSNLVCLIRQVYGINEFNVRNPDPNDGAGIFQSDFLSNSLSSLQSSLARQSALLPLASPSSGVTFRLNDAGLRYKPVPMVGSRIRSGHGQMGIEALCRIF
jgi:hypothetical protein